MPCSQLTQQAGSERVPRWLQCFLFGLARPACSWVCLHFCDIFAWLPLCISSLNGGMKIQHKLFSSSIVYTREKMILFPYYLQRLRLKNCLLEVLWTPLKLQMIRHKDNHIVNVHILASTIRPNFSAASANTECPESFWYCSKHRSLLLWFDILTFKWWMMKSQFYWN